MHYVAMFLCAWVFSLSVFVPHVCALKEKIYFAGRIPKNPPAERVVSLYPGMVGLDVQKALHEAELEREHFIFNGSWVFSTLSVSGKDGKGALSKTIPSLDFVRMILGKMMQSSVIVATISGKTYGTIAEVGYAVAMGGVPVYVFPDPSLTRAEIEDLWFVFQMGAMTSHLWKEEHFKIPNLFPPKTTLKGYQAFLMGLKPPFL